MGQSFFPLAFVREAWLLSAFHDTAREQVAWCETSFGFVNDFEVSRMRSICKGRVNEAMRIEGYSGDSKRMREQAPAIR